MILNGNAVTIVPPRPVLRVAPMAGPPGQGVAAGGASLAVLRKLSVTDFDTEWRTLTAADVGAASAAALTSEASTARAAEAAAEAAASTAQSTATAAGAAAAAAQSTANAAIPSAQKGANSGVSTLDSSGVNAQPPKLHRSRHAPGGADDLSGDYVALTSVQNTGGVFTGAGTSSTPPALPPGTPYFWTWLDATTGTVLNQFSGVA